jgi:murein L,D-transpeptidase YcbB/YkuD
VALAFLLAASPARAVLAEEAKGAVPLPERAPKQAAGQGAEVELPFEPRAGVSAAEPPAEPAQEALDAAPDPSEQDSAAAAPDDLEQKPAKQERVPTPASQRTKGDGATTGTAASAAQKRVTAPKPAETGASPQTSEDDQKPADTAELPTADDDQKPESTASPPAPEEPVLAETSPPSGDDQKSAAAAEPSAEQQQPADATSPEQSDSTLEPAGVASQPGNDAQDAAAPEVEQSGDDDRGEQNAADTAAATPSDAEQKPTDAEPSPIGDAEQKPAGAAASSATGSEAASPPPEPAPPPPSSPVVAAALAQLKDSAITKGSNSADVAALETFYAGHGDAPLWIEGTIFSAKAQAIIGEIKKADEWGLSAADFTLPPAADLPSTPEAQAAEEVKLGLAILKYARYARGGRLTPGRISVLFDQRPGVRDPKAVLTEISASTEPDAYLRSLHPQHEQFARLRAALAKARADGGEGGPASNERDIQRLTVNMERWRWMPPSLGSYYVWNNVPEFIGRVVKNGKTIYAEKIIVGQLKYATPFFSATMRSIVFHPDWTVPETILKEDLQPSLQQGGFFGMADTSILKRHGLQVSYKGKLIDADSVDWLNVNIREYSFIQPPGPANVLGQLKFNFPNRHAVYMHDTPQRELFAETVRTLSHGCIRVRQPDRLAALLLAEDRGWSDAQVQSLLARDQNDVVKLNRSIPVHLTYFTVVADEAGKVSTFADVYGLDGRMATALFGKAAKFSAPVMAEADAGATASTQPAPRKRRSDWTSKTGIPGIFGN